METQMLILNELAHRINASLDLQATLDAIVGAPTELTWTWRAARLLGLRRPEG